MLTNIVAGIILFFVLRMFFQWILELRNIGRVRQADEKMKFLLKPYVSGGTFPTPETFHALMETVASDYHVTCEAMHSLSFYVQEFIQEIFEDAFIPNDKKVEYTDRLRVQLKKYEEQAAGLVCIPLVDASAEKRNTFNSYNQLNLCILISGILVAAVGLMSGTYDIFETFGIFMTVSFGLVIFADLCLKKRRYREIPRVYRYVKKKIEHAWKGTSERRERKRKEYEADQNVQLKVQLEEEKRRLTKWSEELSVRQKDLEEQKLLLEKRIEDFGQEQNSFHQAK